MSFYRLVPWGLFAVLCAWSVVGVLMIRDTRVHDICGHWSPEVEARDVAPDDRYDKPDLGYGYHDAAPSYLDDAARSLDSILGALSG